VVLYVALGIRSAVTRVSTQTIDAGRIRGAVRIRFAMTGRRQNDRFAFALLIRYPAFGARTRHRAQRHAIEHATLGGGRARR
jgi:hypothetical protein